MKRNEHTFQFTGQEISKAALAEKEYHDSRLAFWHEEYAKAVARAKEAGIEVKEYAVTGGMQATVNINPEVSNRLSQCYSKINEHRKAVDDFQIQAAAYGTQANRVYELHPDDVIYFRLAGGPRSE